MTDKCQVFTPEKYVKKLLDYVGYKDNLYNKKIMENSCGDGNFLIEIVIRYIEDSLRIKSLDEIKTGLEQNIYGVEIDFTHYEKCLNNLNKIAKTYNIENVKWNIYNRDILKETFLIKFDFIVGNPPYITYKDLDIETRMFIKKAYQTCSSGKFDYCYAFIEHSLNSLSNNGKMAYLIPNNIFKNVFGQRLRDVLLPHLIKIYDYNTKKNFKNVITSSAILVCNKESHQPFIEYYDIVNNRKEILQKKNLSNKWRFTIDTVTGEKNRFGDYFSASITIATLYNKAYIIKKFIDEKNYIVVDNYLIEKEILRESVSPKTLGNNIKELILFPYNYNNGMLERYLPEEFENKFPKATKYLKIFSNELNARTSDKNIYWFEYGRTQALAHINQPKLLISTIISKKVKVYLLNSECIPYSGIYIIPKRDLSLEEAKKILESDDFNKYVKEIGISISGNSKRITAEDINNFKF